MLSLAFALTLIAQVPGQDTVEDTGQDIAPVNGQITDHAEMPSHDASLHAADGPSPLTEIASDAEHNATAAQQNSNTILQATTTQGVGLDGDDPDAEPQD